MFIVLHLQRQRNELQKEYELLSNRILALRESHAIETDTEEHIKLEYRLSQSNASRDKLAREIEALDHEISELDQITNLHKALLKLNYHKQQHLFRQLIDKTQVGAFVIHGEPEYGQSWLLNRLVRQIPRITVGKVITVNLLFRGRRWDLDAVTRELKRSVGMTNTHSIQEVIDQIHEWWQTQTVILIFHNLDTMDPEYLQGFMQGFWLPLVDKALTIPSHSPFYKLLMLLVDNSGCVDNWTLECAEELNDSWRPHIPIKPPRLAPINIDELANWMEHEYAVLPIQLHSVHLEDILSNCQQGIPQLVIEHICELCGCNWFEREHIWITY